MRFVLLAALMGIVQQPDAGGVRALASEEYVVDYFSDIFLRGAIWRDSGETAAFLVRKNNGELQCLLWPATNEYKGQSFRGRIPDGTVAIVHTHPGAAFNPSVGDARQAREIGLPIFVLTRGHVTAVGADGITLPVVERRSWMTTKGERRCEERWTAPLRSESDRSLTSAY
jgi:hypothetical protein